MTYFLLGLGSNIEPEKHLELAREALAKEGTLVALSPALITEPVGDTFDGSFGNQLAIFQCELPAPMLKHRLQMIEQSLGREPKSPARKTRDRTIDLDIIAEADSLEAARKIAPEESYYAEVYKAWND